MEHAQRTSPVAAELHELRPTWGMLNDMPVALACGGNDSAPVMLCDLSALRRFGVKGPQAAAWLQENGIDTPAGINQWSPLADGGIVCRLASSEFLIEDGWQGKLVPPLAAKFRYGIRGVYPVLHQDGEMALGGVRAAELLVQVCGVNFKALKDDSADVVMTSIAGVGVIAVRQLLPTSPVYRLWCDGSYAPYLWETLRGIAKELGGAVLGVEEMFPGAIKT